MQNVLINKEWAYTLFEQAGNLLLSVVCGTVAVFTVTVKLNPQEVRAFEQQGESFIDQLAQQIADDPQSYQHRNV